MRKNKLHAFSIALGSLLAFAIVFTQFVTPDCVVSDDGATTEQTENSGEKGDGAYISLPSFSLPVPVHVQPNLDAHCLFEIFFEKDRDTQFPEEVLSYPDRFFRTMFRVIISPNAP